MNGTTAHEDRLELVRELGTESPSTAINGIDFIDVDPADEGTLFVSFVFDVDLLGSPPLPNAVGSLAVTDFQVIGGERIASIAVTGIARVASNQVAVSVAPVGDFSIYTLQIGSPPEPVPPRFDPMLCSAAFIFHVECANRFDCKPTTVCPPPIVTPPAIDYMAKDYPAFVTVMLDRLTLLAPRWAERNPADLGVAVVEVLAYVADQLSYRHDVVDTEAYLPTARLRTSVRRHAKLVDYQIGDGSNARVWLVLTLDNDLASGVPVGTRCCTIFDGAAAPDLPASTQKYVDAITAGAQFFEVLADRFSSDGSLAMPRPLYAINNCMPLYNWSATELCLPIGATCAILDGSYQLSSGDVLMFAEHIGPKTGNKADANPANRCAVRLIADGVHDYDPLYGKSRPITRITWHPDDALTFPLCVASKTEAGNDLTGVSRAYGNVILADHGRTLGPPLETMPETLLPAPAEPRFRPRLARSPLTFAASNPFAAPVAPGGTPVSAASAMTWTAAQTLPVLALCSTKPQENPTKWTPLADLLHAGTNTAAFVTEVENDGTAFLRFGDGTNGMAATTEMTFTARYRIGNGSAGNVGRDTIVLMDRSFPGGGYVASLTNPLPATGGIDMETNEHVRQNAPVAFRTQERCVTPQDYADRAMLFTGVAQAAGTFRWTGSWLTMFVTIVRTQNVALDATFKADLENYLDGYRMAGVDLDVEDAIRVPLHVALHVCVQPTYVATDVEAVLLQVFGDGILPDGTLGMFNAQHFAMGRPYYLSPLIAAAQGVDGVQSVRVDAFEREANPGSAGLDAGVLIPDRLELFELANDPNYPERGYFELTVDGGL